MTTPTTTTNQTAETQAPRSGAPAAVRIALTPGTDPAAGLAQLRSAARDLDAAGVRFLVLGDDGESGFDALTVAGWLAPATEHITIVPEAPVTHTEPFHLATATATLDHDSSGRGAWSPFAQTDEAAARLVGRRPAVPAPQAWAEVPVVADAVEQLWLSWDADAIIRDEQTARFIDRERLHYIDFSGTDSVGAEFTITGPSIVPQSPQGALPTLVRVSGPESARAAAQIADIVVLTESASAEDRAVVGEAAADGRDLTLLRAVGAAAVARTSAEELATVLVDLADAPAAEVYAARLRARAGGSTSVPGDGADNAADGGGREAAGS